MPLTERAEMEICDLEVRRRRGSAQWSCRRTVFILLTFTGLMQITSSLALLLHLTGHLPQADSSAELQALSEDLFTEPVSAETFRNAEGRTDVKSQRKHKNIMPAAHLPIKPASGHLQRKIHATIIHWNPEQGSLQHFGYHNGRILVQRSGLYYVYAKTCFRYYDLLDNSHSSGSPTISPFDKGVQLIQYVFLERLSFSSVSRPKLLMKSGNTWQWRKGTYHMCCQQQSGVFSLQARDGLYVSVSNSWMLDPEAEGSYFGAFRVSGEMQL